MNKKLQLLFAFQIIILFVCAPTFAQPTVRFLSLSSSNKDIFNIDDYTYDNGRHLKKRGHINNKTGITNYDYWFTKKIDSTINIFVNLNKSNAYGISINNGAIESIDFGEDVQMDFAERIGDILIVRGYGSTFLLPVSLNKDSLQRHEHIKVSRNGLAIRKNKKYALFDLAFVQQSDYIYDEVVSIKRGWSVRSGKMFRLISSTNQVLLDSLDELYYDYLDSFLINRNQQVVKIVDLTNKAVIWQGEGTPLDFERMIIRTRDPATNKFGVKSAEGQILPNIYDEIQYRCGLLYLRIGSKATYNRLDGSEVTNIQNPHNDSTYLTKINNKIGVVDSSNREIFAPQFDELIGSNSYTVRVGSKYGRLSPGFRSLELPVSYQYITQRGNNLIYLQENDYNRKLISTDDTQWAYVLKDSELAVYDNEDIKFPEELGRSEGILSSVASFERYMKAQTYFHKKLGLADFAYNAGTTSEFYRYAVTEAGTITRTKIPYDGGREARKSPGSANHSGYTMVYSSDAFGNRGTKILYFVKNGVVYAADDHNNRTDKILRYIVGEKAYAADNITGQRTPLVLYYIVNNIVYAADLNSRERTNRILEYVSENIVYAADATSGQRTERKLRYVVGNESTN